MTNDHEQRQMTKNQALIQPLITAPTLGLILLTQPRLPDTAPREQISAAESFTITRCDSRSRQRRSKVNSFQKTEGSSSSRQADRWSYVSHKEIGNERLSHWQ